MLLIRVKVVEAGSLFRVIQRGRVNDVGNDR